MSKYEPLRAFLVDAGSKELRVSFADIEKILGFPLPASKQYPAWWSNSSTNNAMTKAWLNAGYKTTNVDVSKEQVTFQPNSTAAPANGGGPLPRSPIFGSLKGTTFLAPDVDLTAPMELDWKYGTYDPEDALTNYETKKIVDASDLNVSAKIRALAKFGMPRAEIARRLGKRYQHIRNVLVAEEGRVR